MSLTLATRFAMGVFVALVTNVSLAADPITISHRLISSTTVGDLSNVTIELSVSNVANGDLKNIQISSQELSAISDATRLNIDVIPYGTTWTGTYSIDTPFENVYFQKGGVVNFEVKLDMVDFSTITSSVTSTYGE